VIDALLKMPEGAVVLHEGNDGYARGGSDNLHRNDDGLPEEVILSPDMDE